MRVPHSKTVLLFVPGFVRTYVRHVDAIWPMQGRRNGIRAGGGGKEAGGRSGGDEKNIAKLRVRTLISTLRYTHTDWMRKWRMYLNVFELMYSHTHARIHTHTCIVARTGKSRTVWTKASFHFSHQILILYMK